MGFSFWGVRVFADREIIHRREELPHAQHRARQAPPDARSEVLRDTVSKEGIRACGYTMH